MFDSIFLILVISYHFFVSFFPHKYIFPLVPIFVPVISHFFFHFTGLFMFFFHCCFGLVFDTEAKRGPISRFVEFSV